MNNVKVNFIGICVLIFITQNNASACTWPAPFNGSSWLHSDKGLLTFNNNNIMTGWDFTTNWATMETWQCHSTAWLQSDGYIILRTTQSLVLYESNFYGYLCLKLTPIVPSVSYRCHIHNPRQANANNERIGFDRSSTLSGFSPACTNDTTLSQAEYIVLLNQAYNTQNFAIVCPYTFLGKYNYQHTDAISGDVTCGDTSDVMDVCTDKTKISFNYNSCPTEVAYSVTCVDSVPYGNDNYVTVYNGNDAETDITGVDVYRFACFAFSEDGSQGSVVPGSCRYQQQSSTVGNGPGATLQLTKSESCVSCPLLNAPSEGIVSFQTDGANTYANYECNAGFSLAGTTSRMCMKNFTWSGEQPVCTCILPSAPANGSVNVSKDGTTITYSCNVGFVLTGAATRTCQTSSNTWSGASPTCVLCASLASTEGLVTNLSSNGSITSAMFFCQVNYTMNGISTSQCTGTGTWTNPQPSCVRCKTFNSTESQQISFTTDSLVTTATFSCVPGYHLLGSASLQCGVNGSWIGVPATCTCDSPGSPVNGSVAVDGDMAQFQCEIGFTLNGASVSHCLTNGSGWSPHVPTCVGSVSLVTPVGGAVTLSSDGLVTKATYTCLSGYTLVGSSTRYSQVDGTWNSTAPYCVQCVNITNPSSGQVNISTNGTITSAVFTCVPGYNLQGQSLITCLSDGSWSTQSPNCTCNTVSSLSNGTVIYEGVATVHYTCNTGFALNGVATRICSTEGLGWDGQEPSCVQCSALPSVSNGSVQMTSNGTTSQITVHCDVGFTVSGHSQLTCLPTGAWDMSPPVCVLCESLLSPSHGNVTLSSINNIVTIATFSCNLGSTLVGLSTFMCAENGTWNGTVPQCVSCPTLTSPASGSVAMTTDSITTVAFFICSNGYSLLGFHNLTCMQDGSWDHSAPVCVCEAPAPPTDGSAYSNGTSVIYSCKLGFTLLGDSAGYCKNDSTGWSISVPSCVACEPTVNISGGSQSLQTNGTTTGALYTCEVGSSLKGSSTVTCNTTGHWVTDPPQCVSCPSLNTVTSGSINITSNGLVTIATFHCSLGYHVTGADVLTCTTEGSWDAMTSECVCDIPQLPSNGSLTVSGDGQTATFSCEVGFTMQGEATASCSSDGSGWTVTEPSCVECSSLQAPSGGSVTLVTTGSITSAVFTCEAGSTLELQGASNPTCGSDGSWNVTQISCVYCPELNPIDSGAVNVTSNGETSVATYTCDAGYQMVGMSSRACLETGVWQLEVPSCYCIPPAAPINGSIAVSADHVTITYMCDLGFTLTGPITRICQSAGQGWTVTDPACTLCEELQMLGNGSTQTSSNGSVTLATFICDAGFSLDGTSTIVCLSDGSWSLPVPTCKKCPSLSSPSSGSVTMTTDGSVSMAEYACMPLYHLLGDGLSYCWNGTWNNTETPVCVCRSPNAPVNGNVTLADDLMTAMFTCHLGYTLDGEPTSTCSSSGAGWSHSTPSCNQCQSIPVALAGGTVDVSTNGTVTSVSYSCTVGSTLSGTPTQDCQVDGEWTYSQPAECVVCANLSTPSSGQMNITSDGLITLATFFCNDGYQLEGEATLRCLSDGLWTDQEPICNCVSPNSPDNGTVIVSDNKMNATYTCDLHTTLIGQSVRTCKQDGSGWSGTDPSCGQCPQLSHPVNGSSIPSTNGIQSVMTFTCDLGTTLLGDSTLYCQENRTWSSTIPTCVKCIEITSPESGSVTLTTDGIATIATFTCNASYKMTGYVNSSCMVNGQWSSSVPKCSCEDPTAPAHGNVSNLGSIAVYSCELDYTLAGDIIRTCSTNGTGWLGNDPTCVQCLPLETRYGATVNMTTNGTTTMVKYSCSIGMTMTGSALLTCLSNGTWNYATPTCVTCENLPVPANGNFTLTTDGVTTTAQLMCEAGYQSTGSTQLTCHSNGTWALSQNDLLCEPVSDTTDSRSYLAELIGTSVSLGIVIIVLSVLLATFVYLYFRQKHNAQGYTVELLNRDDAMIQSNAKFHSMNVEDFSPETDDGSDDFHIPFPSMPLSPAIAPASHQRHVLDNGSIFSTSPAPDNFQHHGISNGHTPRNFSPMSTTPRSLTSFFYGSSGSNRQFLTPIKNGDIMVKKLNAARGSTSPQQMDLEDTQPSRPTTPMKHQFKVTDEAKDPRQKSKAISDVSN